MTLNSIREIPVQFDVLVAATDECLGGYVQGWVDFAITKQSPGSVTYELTQSELGELGTLTIRKLRDNLSQIGILEASRPERRRETKDELAKVWELKSSKQKHKALAELSRKIRAETDELQEKRRDHLRRVVNLYLERLGEENIWPEPRKSQELERARQGGVQLWEHDCETTPDALWAVVKDFWLKNYLADRASHPLQGLRLTKSEGIPLQYVFRALIPGFDELPIGHVEIVPLSQSRASVRVLAYGPSPSSWDNTAAFEFLTELAEHLRSKYGGPNGTKTARGQRKRDRGPQIGTLEACEDAMKRWLDGGEGITAAAQRAGVDRKTVLRRIPDVLKVVDADTRARWIRILRATGYQKYFGNLGKD